MLKGVICYSESLLYSNYFPIIISEFSGQNLIFIINRSCYENFLALNCYDCHKFQKPIAFIIVVMLFKLLFNFNY